MRKEKKEKKFVARWRLRSDLTHCELEFDRRPPRWVCTALKKQFNAVWTGFYWCIPYASPIDDPASRFKKWEALKEKLERQLGLEPYMCTYDYPPE